MPKTGESDHQLNMNQKQMFNLHRICERSMIVEEAVCDRQRRMVVADEGEREKTKRMDVDANNTDDNGGVLLPDIVPRPLYRLFEVASAFALSLQMELLLLQAKALRRGAWGSGSIVGGEIGSKQHHQRHQQQMMGGECISVSPVLFYDEKKVCIGRSAPIAVMAIHFWSCDDSYRTTKSE